MTTGSATDGSGNAYTLFYPTNLATDGIDNPIVTWGNGTGSTPNNYAATLSHLASWGFVVVASNSGQTGWGTEMWAGAQYMMSQDDRSSSVFYHQLDTANMSGSSDFLSTPAQQTAYYNGINAPAARAAVVGGDHNVIQGANNGMLGYLTAWFRYTLQVDGFARAAFVGSPPQLNTNTAWTNQAEKGLP